MFIFNVIDSGGRYKSLSTKQISALSTVSSTLDNATFKTSHGDLEHDCIECN